MPSGPSRTTLNAAYRGYLADCTRALQPALNQADWERIGAYGTAPVFPTPQWAQSAASSVLPEAQDFTTQTSEDPKEAISKESKEIIRQCVKKYNTAFNHLFEIIDNYTKAHPAAEKETEDLKQILLDEAYFDGNLFFDYFLEGKLPGFEYYYLYFRTFEGAKRFKALNKIHNVFMWSSANVVDVRKDNWQMNVNLGSPMEPEKRILVTHDPHFTLSLNWYAVGSSSTVVNTDLIQKRFKLINNNRLKDQSYEVAMNMIDMCNNYANLKINKKLMVDCFSNNATATIEFEVTRGRLIRPEAVTQTAARPASIGRYTLAGIGSPPIGRR